jgi:hypothetical protein
MPLGQNVSRLRAAGATLAEVRLVLAGSALDKFEDAGRRLRSTAQGSPADSRPGKLLEYHRSVRDNFVRLDQQIYRLMTAAYDLADDIEGVGHRGGGASGT